MKNKIIWIIGVFLTLYISGCSNINQRTTESVFLPGTEQLPKKTIFPTILVKSTITMTEKPQPPQTRTVSPPTATITPTPRTVENEEVINECEGGGIAQPTPFGFGINGTIVYERKDGKVYAIGDTPLTQSQLFDEGRWISVFGFSPDGRWLAYSPVEEDSEQSDKRRIILLSNIGEKIERVVDIKEFESEIDPSLRFIGITTGHWISDNLLYVTIAANNPDPKGPTILDKLVKIVNPFEGRWDLTLLDELPNWSPYQTTSANDVGISPDMSRILYMSQNGLILWDPEKKVPLWTETYTGWYKQGVQIEWNPSSTMVVIAMNNWLGDQTPPLLMSRNGSDQRWIGNDEFPAMEYGSLGSVAWSPDGQRLALVGKANDKERTPYLYIYDTKNNRFDYRCPIIRDNGNIPTQIHWSPDGRFIAYAYEQYSSQDYPLQLLDLQTGELFDIAQEAFIVGWSDKFPVELP